VNSEQSNLLGVQVKEYNCQFSLYPTPFASSLPIQPLMLHFITQQVSTFKGVIPNSGFKTPQYK